MRRSRAISKQLIIFGVFIWGGVLFSTMTILAAQPSFQGSGDLVGGDYGSFAYDVSPDGSVVVGVSYSTLCPTNIFSYPLNLLVPDEGGEAFRWQSGTIAGLGDLQGGETRSSARGTSSNGLVVVGIGRDSSPTGQGAFRWENGTMVKIAANATAYGVSNNGSVIVGAEVIGSDTKATKWEDGSTTYIGNLAGGSTWSVSYGVSADGSVIVGASNCTAGKEAFRWENDIMVGLGDLSGGDHSSEAYEISGDGSTVVGFSSSSLGLEAFRWRDGESMIGLGDLPGGDYYSIATATSGDGSIIIGYNAIDSWDEENLRVHTFEAFMWDEANGMQPLDDVLEDVYGLDLSEWSLTRAMGISDDGTTIVGWGINPYGQNESWTATICEPITCADFSGDLSVNFSDFCVLAKEWLKDENPLEADLVDDDKIDLTDLDVFNQQWLESCQL